MAEPRTMQRGLAGRGRLAAGLVVAGLVAAGLAQAARAQPQALDADREADAAPAAPAVATPAARASTVATTAATTLATTAPPAPRATAAVPDPLDARVHRLAEELRCVVCQNQSLADSQAPLAQDLKQQVHEQLAQGRSEDEVRAYLVARYGDFVLYRPPVNAQTWLLWWAPLALVALGVAALVAHARRLPAQPTGDGAEPAT